MIAQVVFDLPLDGPFDYLVPSHLADKIAVGMRVKVSFGTKTRMGFVVALLSQSDIPKLKSIQALRDACAVFNTLDLGFARDFSAYYGCSLGEALGTMLRNKNISKPSIRREHKPCYVLHQCSVSQYASLIADILKTYKEVLILVPDVFRMQMFSKQLNLDQSVRIATRSGVFEADGAVECVIMVDDEDDSYKQEQMPMYETRQVLLMRSKIYGFDIAFIGTSPSAELMALTRTGQVKLIEATHTSTPVMTPVDLSNYKFMPGMVSPPVYDALQAALKAGKKSILVLNRRGSYRITRCVDCAQVLKCSRCDSPLIYSRSAGKYLCRHCTTTAPGEVVCPNCHKSSWRSKGIGVEQIQAELKKYFPQAKIVSFERAAELSVFDILITTRAVLRFQGMWRVHMAAFIDFDAELNRLDMRSSCNAYSLARHISAMTLERVFIQTRNINHYVIESLKVNDSKVFYDEELKIRKELGFCPFKHWVKITFRAKSEKSAQEASLQVYNQLNKTAPENCLATPPIANVVARKRDQFLFNVMVQADEVERPMAFIKSVLGQIKLRGRVIVALNVDP